MPLFNWSDYLALAKDLSLSDKENALRSAISRAYYAAYNEARAYCNSKHIEIPPSKDSHQAMWNKFLTQGRHLRGVHTKGDLLRLQRVHADYTNTPFERIEDEVKQAIHDSEAILGWLKSASSATH